MREMKFDGSRWSPLGKSHLMMTRYGLLVTSIGSSGEDGVRQVGPAGVRPGPAPNPYHRLLRGGLEDPNVPVGAFSRVTLRGTLNGEPEQVISVLTATKCDDEKCRDGNYVNLGMDMSPLAPDSITFEYLQDGRGVFSESGLPAIFTGCCTKLPDDWGAGGATWIFRTEIAAPVYGQCAVPNGSAVSVDEVRFLPVGGAARVEGPFALDWTASQVEGFVVLPNRVETMTD